jgi:hypothetical protein
VIPGRTVKGIHLLRAVERLSYRHGDYTSVFIK